MPASARSSGSRTPRWPRCSAPARSSSARPAWADPSTRSSSTRRSSLGMACRVLGAVVNKVDADAHPTLPDVLRGGPGAPRHRAAGHAAVPAVLSQPDAVDAHRAAARRGAQPGRRPRPRRSSTSRSARCSRATCSSASARAACSSCPGDRQDIILATLAANRTQQALDREPRLLERAARPVALRALARGPGGDVARGDGLLGRHPSERARARRRSASRASSPTSSRRRRTRSRARSTTCSSRPIRPTRPRSTSIKRLVADHFDVDGLLATHSTASGTADPGS